MRLTQFVLRHILEPLSRHTPQTFAAHALKVVLLLAILREPGKPTIFATGFVISLWVSSILFGFVFQSGSLAGEHLIFWLLFCFSNVFSFFFLSGRAHGFGCLLWDITFCCMAGGTDLAKKRGTGKGAGFPGFDIWTLTEEATEFALLVYMCHQTRSGNAHGWKRVQSLGRTTRNWNASATDWDYLLSGWDSGLRREEAILKRQRSGGTSTRMDRDQARKGPFCATHMSRRQAFPLSCDIAHHAHLNNLRPSLSAAENGQGKEWRKESRNGTDADHRSRNCDNRHVEPEGHGFCSAVGSRENGADGQKDSYPRARRDTTKSSATILRQIGVAFFSREVFTTP